MAGQHPNEADGMGEACSDFPSMVFHGAME